MALSSWDTFALNKDSEPIRGYAENHNGVGIEIYKNWLYIHDDTMKDLFNEDAHKFSGDYESTPADQHYGFTGTVVMQIQEGFVRYGGWDIYVERGPKNGVYVVAESHQTDYEAEDEDGGRTYPTLRQDVLVGCGVYGYMSDFELYRLEMEADGVDVDELMTKDVTIGSGGWSTKDPDKDMEGRVEFIVFDEDAPEGEQVHVAWEGEEKNPIFVGVNVECVEFLKEVVARSKSHIWAKDDVLDNLDFSKGLRYNPGDAFFEANIEGLEVGGTPVGEAQTPLLGQMFEQ